MWKRVTTAIVVALVAATASAQTTSPAGGTGQQPTATSPQGAQTTGAQDPGGSMMTPAETRPATTTFMGDTGLWFVPTGEVLPAKQWSFSVYRVNFDYNEGFTDVSQLAADVRLRPGRPVPRLFGAVQARPPHRPRRAAAVLRLRPGRRRRQRVPVRARGLVGQPVRRRLARRQGQPRVAVRPEAGGVRPPRHGQAADRRATTTRASAPARPTSPSTPSSARKSTSASSSPASAASSSAASRTTSRSRTASAGASARACRRRKNLRLTAELHGEAYFDDTLDAVRASLIGERRLGRAGADQPRLAGQRLGRPDLAEHERRLRRRRAELAHEDGRPLASSASFEDETGDSLGLPDAARVPPRRAHLRAAAAAATAAATAATARRTGRRR